MALPNDLIPHILKSLKKCDLKSVRLVSVTWGTFATELLFDQAYVSNHPENLEVFKAITQNPVLSKCVKTLRYDAVDFLQEYRKINYLHDLWMEMRYRYRPDQRIDVFRVLQARSSDPEVHAWVNFMETHPSQPRKDEIWRTCKDYKFIDQGHLKYQEYAAMQSDNGYFVETLVAGLQQLQNLSSVILDGQWPHYEEELDATENLILERSTGSPLARNWSMFYVSPWSHTKNLADLYWAIICALIRSRRQIHSFDVRHKFSVGIPEYVLDRSQRNSLSFHGLDIAAFSGLRRLILNICTYRTKKFKNLFPKRDGLRLLLGSMHHLEALNLFFQTGHDKNELARYTLDQIFPKEGEWSQLTTLSLCNFASSAADLLSLLIRAMPNLTRLTLGWVELLTESWEGVIECMMQSMHLLCFKMYSSEFLDRGDPELHHGNIKNYVENGGRHPYLRSDQPDSAAQDYVTENLRCFCTAASSIQKANA